MVAERDFEPAFSGKHDNTILGVANKDYMAGAIANKVAVRMIARGVIKETNHFNLQVPDFSYYRGYGVVHNLKPELQTKIRNAFFNWLEGTSLQKGSSKKITKVSS